MEEKAKTVPRSARDLEQIGFMDVTSLVDAVRPHVDNGTRATVGMLAIVASELRMIRVSLAERNALLVETNTIASEGRRVAKLPEDLAKALESYRWAKTAGVGPDVIDSRARVLADLISDISEAAGA